MKRGYTLLEMMLVLLSAVLVMMLCVNFLFLLKRSKEIDVGVTQLDIMELQLQHELMLGYSFSLEDSSLCYTKFDSEVCLSFDGSRLIKTPGYEILLFDVNEGSMSLSDDFVVISGTYQEESFSIALERLKK